MIQWLTVFLRNLTLILQLLMALLKIFRIYVIMLALVVLITYFLSNLIKMVYLHTINRRFKILESR